ncbi:MAG: SOS response-associated peptidase [Crocinitomicaceae bacterium]|nr:SOS response-associated peptidase [Crocinitomicaceae bacterium]
MCYDIYQLKEREFRRALRKGGLSEDEIKKIQEEWLNYQKQHPEIYGPLFHVNGFEHKPLFTIIYDGSYKGTRFTWGLIPSWAKDKKTADDIRNKTINARGETIFEKPSFRDAAKHKRCLIVVDGFFEYYHKDGKSYPYFVFRKDGEATFFGGLWSEWVDKETGEIMESATIVTTLANELMTKIHNNPKADGPRMPLILEPSEFKTWLSSDDKIEIQELINPLQNGELEAYTVHKLRGKESVANGPEVIEAFVYDGLVE